ncbi:butyrophilin-like protein 10 [Dasypus novemcinctus]|uniref:butyrophilin-like protein 10 n=1 Tax=Dasypus novemcinctus TaxID=9361 RepID=UPI0039C99C4A
MVMKSPRRSPVMAPSCLVAGTLLLFHFIFSHADSGQFHVIGPQAPVIALVGEEAVLPCHLSLLMDAQDMEVNWYRDRPFGLVHQYVNLQDHMEQQMPEYQGRTEFLKDNITTGHVALRIHHIRPSDEGEYSCSFENAIYFHQANFQVLVTGSGTAPHIHIDHGETKGLNLTCTSMGWYPEPEVQWRDLQGERLAPAPETKTSRRNGMFHVETSIMLDKSSKENVACYIRNPVLGVEREVHISVTDALFPGVSPWPVIAPVIVVLLVIIGIVCVLLMRASKSKDKFSLIPSHQIDVHIPPALQKSRNSLVLKNLQRCPAISLQERLSGQLMMQHGELQETYVSFHSEEIKEQNETLIKENEEIKEQKEKLIKENEELKEQKEKLIKENEERMEKNEKLIKENEEIKEQKDENYYGQVFELALDNEQNDEDGQH